jgi:hypothetical protein
MKLTGKCKGDFEKWMFKENLLKDLCIKHQIISMNFYHLSKSMQYGVYVDFFDSVGLIIQTDIGSLRFSDMQKEIWYQSGVLGYRFNKETKTRQEARIEAIEKANKIYNESK